MGEGASGYRRTRPRKIKFASASAKGIGIGKEGKIEWEGGGVSQKGAERKVTFLRGTRKCKKKASAALKVLGEVLGGGWRSRVLCWGPGNNSREAIMLPMLPHVSFLLTCLVTLTYAEMMSCECCAGDR